MVIFQRRSNRKSTGGAYKRMSVKRQHMMGSPATLTKLGETRRQTTSKLGGANKHRVLATSTANVFDPSSKKFTKATISTISENPANRNFARRNIMTKGTVIETSAGKAKITNRPGQEGAINAVLVQ
jgi:small subunit ribosomal protein S8e